MKKLLLALVLIPALAGVARAADDAVDCAKKDGVVKCEAKKDNVVLDSISVNGGDCDVAATDKILHHAYNKGDKFSIPANNGGLTFPGFGCGYVRTVTIETHDGKKKTFNAL